MPGPRQPIELVIAKGKKHLGEEEIRQRRASEIKPCPDDLTPPPYLTAAQKKQFVKLAGQLNKLKIMGETDVEALARYVTAESLYEQAVKGLRKIQSAGPEASTVEEFAVWTVVLEKLDRRVDRYYKQARGAASDLGLTITSRCKLVVPVKEEEPPKNKFSSLAGGKV